jgi:hypothetical protein
VVAERKNHQFGSDKSPKGVLDESLILLGAVGESVTEASRGNFSLSQLKDIVKQAALHWGAKSELLNLLMRDIPKLLEELQFLTGIDNWKSK